MPAPTASNCGRKLVDEGQAEIEAMRQKALREIAAAKTQALVDVQNQVGDLALLVAGKVLIPNLMVVVTPNSFNRH